MLKELDSSITGTLSPKPVFSAVQRCPSLGRAFSRELTFPAIHVWCEFRLLRLMWFAVSSCCCCCYRRFQRRKVPAAVTAAAAAACCTMRESLFVFQIPSRLFFLSDKTITTTTTTTMIEDDDDEDWRGYRHQDDTHQGGFLPPLLMPRSVIGLTSYLAAYVLFIFSV